MLSINQANTYALGSLAGTEFSCPCGRRHVVKTREIVVREGALKELPDVAARIAAPLARVIIACDGLGAEAAGKAASSLNAAGFRAEVITVEPGRLPSASAAENIEPLPEDLKLIIAVGGGTVADLVKYQSARAGITCMVIPTSPAGEGYLLPSALLYANGFRELYITEPPAALLCDLEFIKDIPVSHAASGLGAALSRRLALFDWKFASLMTGEYYCPEVSGLALSGIDGAEGLAAGLAAGDKNAAAALMEYNIRLGLYGQMINNSRISCGGETAMAHALEMLFAYESRPLKMYGETLFLCALAASEVYKRVLINPLAADFTPPDNPERLSLMREYLGVEEKAAIEKIRPLPSEREYRVLRHKYLEYRHEFLALAEDLNRSLKEGYKKIKRVYPDCGYNLINYIEEGDIKTLLAFAPDVREKYTFLTFMKQFGMLNL